MEWTYGVHTEETYAQTHVKRIHLETRRGYTHGETYTRSNILWWGEMYAGPGPVGDMQLPRLRSLTVAKHGLGLNTNYG